MNNIAGFAWECSCGHVEYSEEDPEECNQCGALESFIRMPEELLKAREQDMLSESNAKISRVSKTGRKKK